MTHQLNRKRSCDKQHGTKFHEGSSSDPEPRFQHLGTVDIRSHINVPLQPRAWRLQLRIALLATLLYDDHTHPDTAYNA
jgi:hypothetical protein